MFKGVKLYWFIWLVAAMLWGIVLLIVPMPERFSVKVLEDKLYAFKDYVTYHDLDADSLDERVRVVNDFFGATGLIVEKGLAIVDQWNFPGFFASNRKICFADLNGDHADEAIVFTYADHRIMYSVLDFKNDTVPAYGRVFSDYKTYEGKEDFCVYFRGVRDVDGDGIQEIYAYVLGAFTAYPRRFYRLNIATEETVVSQEIGTLFCDGVFEDITGDGIPEMVNDSWANGNCESDVPYNDYHTWLVVLDQNLKPLFEPVKGVKYPGYMRVMPCLNDGHTVLYCCMQYNGLPQPCCMLKKYSVKGVLLDEITLDINQVVTSYRCAEGEFALWILTAKGGVYGVRPDLSYSLLYNINDFGGRMWDNKLLDVNGDGYQEIISLNARRNGLILSIPELGEEYPLPAEVTYTSCASFDCYHGEDDQTFFISMGHKLMLFQLNDNPYFQYRWVLFVLLALLCYGMVWVIWRLWDYRRINTELLERKLIESQMIGAQKMISPHLTLNLMSSIADLFDKQDRKTAEKIFNRYTRMLRDALVNSGTIEVALEDELDFIRNYVELERFRLSGSFKYIVTLHDDVDLTLSIPRMLIYTFVENAVKHGLKNLSDREGLLKLVFTNSAKGCTMIIEDNGVGRSVAKLNKTAGSGKGLEILDTVIDYQNRHKKGRIHYHIEDLFDGDKPMGTRVIIHCSMN